MKIFIGGDWHTPGRHFVWLPTKVSVIMPDGAAGYRQCWVWLQFVTFLDTRVHHGACWTQEAIA